MLQRSARKRPKLTPADCLLWGWLSRLWSDWRSTLVIVKPETVVAWHRAGLRRFWTLGFNGYGGEIWANILWLNTEDVIALL